MRLFGFEAKARRRHFATPLKTPNKVVLKCLYNVRASEGARRAKGVYGSMGDCGLKVQKEGGVANAGSSADQSEGVGMPIPPFFVPFGCTSKGIRETRALELRFATVGKGG